MKYALTYEEIIEELSEGILSAPLFVLSTKVGRKKFIRDILEKYEDEMQKKRMIEKPL